MPDASDHYPGMKTESDEVGQSGEFEVTFAVRGLGTTDTANSMWRLNLTRKERDDLVAAVRKIVDPILRSQI